MDLRRITLRGLPLIIVVASAIATPAADGKVEVGVEGQVYPAGVIGAAMGRVSALRIAISLHPSQRDSLSGRGSISGGLRSIGPIRAVRPVRRSEPPILSSCSRPRRSVGVFHSGNSSAGPWNPRWLWVPKSISVPTVRMWAKARSYSAVLL
jgi:hypothetical protein